MGSNCTAKKSLTSLGLCGSGGGSCMRCRQKSHCIPVQIACSCLQCEFSPFILYGLKLHPKRYQFQVSDTHANAYYRHRYRYHYWCNPIFPLSIIARFSQNYPINQRAGVDVKSQIKMSSDHLIKEKSTQEGGVALQLGKGSHAAFCVPHIGLFFHYLHG